jgi:hypothetical protein
VPKWIVVACALTMAAGTAGGGMRIIRTMGQRLVKLQPVQGFAAETTAACVIYGASAVGVPVSTTHVISTSIMGVGATKRLSAVKWGVVERIVWAWVITLPVTGLLGAALVWADPGAERQGRPGGLRRRAAEGMREDERGPGARLALEPHLAAVRLDHVLDDRQAEARAPLLARARLVHPVEPLEDPLLGFLRDARAVVGHDDLDPAVGRPWPSTVVVPPRGRT